MRAGIGVPKWIVMGTDDFGLTASSVVRTDILTCWFTKAFQLECLSATIATTPLV